MLCLLSNKVLFLYIIFTLRLLVSLSFEWVHKILHIFSVLIRSDFKTNFTNSTFKFYEGKNQIFFSETFFCFSVIICLWAYNRSSDVHRGRIRGLLITIPCELQSSNDNCKRHLIITCSETRTLPEIKPCVNH